ncbi:Retroviral aspartyl protease [Popillia japonica]|uniref:Retroviral aspartyl protease n=1 Tax=Popillia japonica TaxID=7064 RepID=A0AAW1MYH8_POPJA
MSSGKSTSWTVPILILEFKKTLTFLVDTGADVNCIPLKLIPPRFVNQIRNTNKVINGPDGNPLEVSGWLAITLVHNKQNFSVNSFVIKNLTSPILSRETISQLKLLKLSKHVNASNVNNVTVESEFPNLFKEIGEFKGEGSIKLKEGATPFAQTAPRPVPIPLMQKLEREIKPETCEFGNLKDELIRDRIVVGMSDTKISEAMQLKSNLTLNDRQSENINILKHQKHIQRNKSQAPPIKPNMT